MTDLVGLPVRQPDGKRLEWLAAQELSDGFNVHSVWTQEPRMIGTQASGGGKLGSLGFRWTQIIP